MCLQTGLQVGKGWWPRQHSTQMTGIGCCGFSEVSNRFLRFQLHVFYGGIVFLHWDQPQIWLKSGVILGALCSGATHDTVQVIKLGVQRQACKISLQQQMFLWIVPHLQIQWCEFKFPRTVLALVLTFFQIHLYCMWSPCYPPYAH